MLALMAGNPLAGALDLSALRILSCGGSPQSDAVVARAIALFGCEFFVSYGMTGAFSPSPLRCFGGRRSCPAALTLRQRHRAPDRPFNCPSSHNPPKNLVT